MLIAHCSHSGRQQLHVMVFNVHSTLESANEGDGDGVFALYIYFMTFRYRSIAAKTRKETDFSIWNTCHAFLFSFRCRWRKWAKCAATGDRWSYFSCVSSYSTRKRYLQFSCTHNDRCAHAVNLYFWKIKEREMLCMTRRACTGWRRGQ